MNIKDWIYTRKDSHFKKGDVIFNERDEGEEMYFIDSGEIQIVKRLGDVDVYIAKLRSGNFFGEMSLITGGKRVASAIAFTDCNLHVMNKEVFMSNITNNRDFLNKVLVTFARRLEETDLYLALLFKMASNSSKP